MMNSSRRLPFQQSWPRQLWHSKLHNMSYAWVNAAHYYGETKSIEKIIDDFKSFHGLEEDDVGTQTLVARFHLIRKDEKELLQRTQELKRQIESGKISQHSLIQILCNVQPYDIKTASKNANEFSGYND